MPMRIAKCLALVAVMVAATMMAVAGEVQSGLEPGKAIGAFDVVKVAGAPDDGVAVGDQLCYRCKYGGRPMAMVFTRTTDEKLAALVKKLDATVAEGASKDLKAFVNVLAENRDTAEAAAKKLASSTANQNVPIVVPVEFENGPANYGINPQAQITVIVATGGKVIANRAYGEALSDSAISEILADVHKLMQ